MSRRLHLLHALDAHRAAFTARLDALPEAVVHASPGPGAWSLAQIADHLARIDGLVRPDGKPAGTLARATSRARGRAMAAIISLPVRYPAPPGAGRILPEAAPRWPEVRERWAGVRTRWHTAEPGEDAVALRHPIAGPLLWDDALAFVLAHHRHHDAQVRRTLAALEESAGGEEA
ncbi:DinB family protein [Rubrivirga sp.]|uniref:DinB family protein n=1 Tax=Rubrivirga sp. TaxID=1885344 RepID=UPI003B527F4B